MIKSISCVGEKKLAKTTFGLTAPHPMVTYDFEDGTERVEPRFIQDAAGIVVKSMIVPLPSPAVEIGFYLAKWQEFINDYYKQLTTPSVVSIMLDTATAVRQLRADAQLDLLNIEAKKNNKEIRKQLMQIEWTPANEAVRDLILQARAHKKILILVHHLKAKYAVVERGKQAVDTGEVEPDGYNKTGDIVDVELWFSKKEGKPEARISTCGLSKSAEGLVVQEPTYKKIDDLITGYRNLGRPQGA